MLSNLVEGNTKDKTMPDFILIEGDKANFMPNFGPAVVVFQPGKWIKME
jgi:hypothetical protein